MVERYPQSEVFSARAEVYRLRATGGDIDTAIADYQMAISMGTEPADTHRGMGHIYRTRKQAAEAKASYERYLERAPEAPDALMIRSYMEALGT
jgi:regulator of sirC expression with transglutaminase-like and TPR domain